MKLQDIKANGVVQRGSSIKAPRRGSQDLLHLAGRLEEIKQEREEYERHLMPKYQECSDS
jgi:hypothetical protein